MKMKMSRQLCPVCGWNSPAFTFNYMMNRCESCDDIQAQYDYDKEIEYDDAEAEKM